MELKRNIGGNIPTVDGIEKRYCWQYSHGGCKRNIGDNITTVDGIEILVAIFQQLMVLKRDIGGNIPTVTCPGLTRLKRSSASSAFIRIAPRVYKQKQHQLCFGKKTLFRRIDKK